MFDFEKLEVYRKSKLFNRVVFNFLQTNKEVDRTIKDQLRRASISIMLNIAEGAGRSGRADKRNFFVIARGSTFETAAIFDYLQEEAIISKAFYHDVYCKAEELSKMLYALIKGLEVVKNS